MIISSLTDKEELVSKKVGLPFAVLSNADLSQATLTSLVTDTPYVDNFVVQIDYATTAAGIAMAFSNGSAETDTLTIQGYAS